MRLFLLLTSVILAGSALGKRYDGYQLLEVTPTSKAQLDELRLMMFNDEKLDFWLEPTRITRPVHVLVAPAQIADFKHKMAQQNLPVTVLRENVQDHLDAENKRRSLKPETRAYDYSDYNLFEDFMTEIDNLAASCPEGKSCTTEVIGSSTEGRDLKILKITDDPIDESKAWFWMDSCIHAREWLACATLMNVVNRMITDESAREELDSFNWIILPVFNPDGYSYTFTDDRYWRKSRNVNEDTTCIGTDLNRNHGFDWNTGGSSSNPCSDTYHGSSAASEPEVSIAEAYALDVEGTIIAWLSFHTYGQYWLVPYGNCSEHHEWGADVQDVADVTCSAIEDTDGTSWDCGNSCIELYGTSGTTADFAMGAAGVKYSYTPELRGPGFDPPTSAIAPSFAEIWNGFVAKIAEIKAKEGYMH